MEVHPERSGGTIVDGVPQADTTQVTTNVMVHDGSTIVIGGLIEEQSVESSERVPYLGSLPLVGHAFRSKSERIDRTELIVLITPRIVDHDEAAAQGDSIKYEHEQRAQYFRNHLEPLNRGNLSRIAFERAQDDFEKGKLISARQHIHDSLRHSKNDAKSHRLRDEIERAIEERNRSKLNLRERWKRSNLLFPRKDKTQADEPLPDDEPIVPVPTPEELETSGG
jgi:type IV pilus assembly protein PilQ